MSHTPGPWEWIGHDLESPRSLVSEAIVECGQFCQGGMVRLNISDADRRLIAAAPQLLEALQQLIASAEESQWPEELLEMINARDAIAKAISPPAVGLLPASPLVDEVERDGTRPAAVNQGSAT